MYRKHPIDLSGKHAVWVLRSLMAARFFSLLILSALLLGILLKWISTRSEKPVVVIALDASQSVGAGKSAATENAKLVQALQMLQSDLGDAYDVKLHSFGKSFSQTFDTQFDQKETNIAGALQSIEDQYDDGNLGAVILASDGLYNAGANPLYYAQHIKSPIYTVGLGDTVQQKDVLIKRVKHNQIVYTGNQFPVEIEWQSYGYAGKQVAITISHAGKQVFSTRSAIQSNTFFQNLPVSLEARNAGTQHYVIDISVLPGEVSTVNNRFDLFINVIDGKQKIAIVSLAPHPDISAYKQSIEQNENYTVSAFSFASFSAASFKEYSLVIFHQLPGMRGEGLNLIRAAKENAVPSLFVIGAQTGLAFFTSAEPAINPLAARNAVNDVIPVYESGFSLFTFPEEELSIIQKFPPLQAPYAQVQLTIEHEVLFKQQIGYVKTDQPLVAFGKSAGRKLGFVLGEGFWKWRMYDAQLSNQKVTQSLTGKIVQFLAAKDDRSRFRITGNNKFDEGEQVKLDAEVYNESYELVQAGEVQLTLRNEAGKKFEYTFSKTEKAYSLNLGVLPVGSYQYEAFTSIGNQVQKRKGVFSVVPLQLEFLQTTANHQLLRELAEASGGQLVYPQEISKLSSAIQSEEAIKPVLFSEEQMRGLIQLRWIFFLLLGLLSFEWFVRKWNGAI